MSDDTDEDKQYEPSQKKLDDARKKGEIAKSADLTTAAGYGGFLIVAATVGPASLIAMGATLSILLGQADGLSSDLFAGRAAPLAAGVAAPIGGALLPWMAGPAALAILSILAQRAFVVAPSKLSPKGSRISLIKGIANKFGRAGLFEFFKSFAKLTLYCLVLGLFLWAQLPRIVDTMRLTPGMVMAELGRLLIALLGIVLVVSAAIGVLDFVFQKAEHTRKNRMSRKELTDEQKQAEGDPAMKQQRRQKGIELAMSQMMADMPKADVVIVNPTHYAVALQWNRGSGRAPVCLAKGIDAVAARIREAAAIHGIAIHSDPPTARALFSAVDIGAEIHPDHYRAVAAAIRFAERLRRAARK